MKKKNIIPVLLIVFTLVWPTLFAQQIEETAYISHNHQNDSTPTREEIVRDSVMAAEAEKRRDSLIMLHSDMIDLQVILQTRR